MSRPLALLFAVISVVLMSSIGISISYGRVGYVILFSIASVLFIGFGFIVKAKIRKKNKHAE